MVGRGRPRKTEPDAFYSELPDGVQLGFGGFGIAAVAAAKKLGLYDILVRCFGDQKTLKILTIAAYYVFEDSNQGLTLLEHFARTQMCFTECILSSQRASELFADISSCDLKLFFERWIPHCMEKHNVFYDVTSISSYSEGITEVARGYNRDHENLPQVNLGLFMTSGTALPLFYYAYNGGINDFTAFPYVLEQAKALGLYGQKLSVVCDGIFSEAKTLDFVCRKSFGIIVGTPLHYSPGVRDAVITWRRKPDHHSEIENTIDCSITSHECSFTIGGINGRLIMFKHIEKTALEQTTVMAKIKATLAKVKELKYSMPTRPPASIMEICDAEKIGRGKESVYKLKPSNDCLC